MSNFYVTTPIYYVNDKPHIGHFYSTLVADVLARFRRLEGDAVLFSTGTDEHGQKVEKAAQNANVDTLDFVTNNARAFRDMSTAMGASNDIFVRTTDAQHKRAVSLLWQTLTENGCIYLSQYSGWYAARDESFYAEEDLVAGLAPTGAPVEWLEEDCYFFNLSQWQEPLLKFYNDFPDFIYPESRRNEIISFVSGGLKDLCVSRANVKWGIPVPGDARQTVYVWLDALANYISGLGYPDSQLYQDFWNNVNPESPVHIVGKDIIRFHAVYWPAFLMAARLPLPCRIVAHGWWQNEGQKISKSLGNAVDYAALIDDFGLDAVRYFFMREIALGSDGNFSRSVLINRVNADLSNNIGNFVQRSLAMIHNYCVGLIPEPNFNEMDKAMLAQLHNTKQLFKACIAAYRFDEALGLVQNIATQGNQFLDREAPWALRKQNPERMATVLYLALEIARMIGGHLMPFIPTSASLLLEYAGNGMGPNELLPAYKALFPRITSQ